MEQEIGALLIFFIAILYVIYKLFNALIPKNNCKNNCNCIKK